MILSTYLIRRFFVTLLRLILIVSGLIILGDTLETIRALSDRGVSAGEAMVLSFLRMPALLGEAMPFLIVIAGLAFSIALARGSELVVIRASGRAMLRAMLPVAFASALFGLLFSVLIDPFVARLETIHGQWRLHYISPVEGAAVRINKDGYWLRQSDASGHQVIHAKEASESGRRLVDVTALYFDATGQLTQRIAAHSAILSQGSFMFIGPKLWDLRASSTNPEATAQELSVLRQSTSLTAEDILGGYPDPQRLFLWEIPAQIEKMEAAGFTARPHALHLAIALARPFFYAGMVLMGMVFTLGSARLGTLGMSILLSASLGFALQFLMSLARTLGLAGEIWITTAAFAPALLSLGLAVGLFLHKEDG